MLYAIIRSSRVISIVLLLMTCMHGLCHLALGALPQVEALPARAYMSLTGESLGGLHPPQVAGCPVQGHPIGLPVQGGRYGSACVHRGGVQRALAVTRPQLGLEQHHQQRKPLRSESAGEAALYQSPPLLFCLRLGLLKEVLSCRPTQVIWCSLWQTAAVLCRKLRSLHLGVLAEQFVWPGPTACAKLASPSSDSEDGINISDPWIMTRRR